MSKFVELNPKANIFHDPSTGITVLKGKKKELNAYQEASPRVKNAIRSGHLHYVELTKEEKAKYEKDKSEKVDKEVKKDDTLSPDKVKEISGKIVSKFKEGSTPQKIADSFNLKELKAVANAMEIELEDDDTKATIATAIVEVLEEELGSDDE